jgi:hypothetical protein
MASSTEQCHFISYNADKESKVPFTISPLLSEREPTANLGTLTYNLAAMYTIKGNLVGDLMEFGIESSSEKCSRKQIFFQKQNIIKIYL